nr:lantibiotic dehydratase [Aceticella autotrophica]
MNYITCEITYLASELRSANVSKNIHCSEYELALFTNSSRDEEHTLTLDDILIGIENNIFYAKSKKLNKRLIITINNMLNPQIAPNAVRFLYDISLDGTRIWYMFPWEIVFNKFPYVPKVIYKNFTLTPEEWKINFLNIKANKKSSFSEFKELFMQYCKYYKVPNYVYITSGDNRILLNIDDDKCLDILYHEFINNPIGVTLTSYEDENFNIIKSERGSYVSELVIPLVKIKTQQPKSIMIKENSTYISSKSPTRLKIPFNEWLYLKLYGTSSMEEELICFYISEFCRNLVSEEKINKYFFIRYADPEPHIRLRLNASQYKLIKIYPELQNWLQSLIKKGLMTCFTIDCYEREIERYGGKDLIDIAESVFYIDSMVTEDILREKRLHNIEFSDEIIGMITIINYMEQFDWDYKTQLKFLESQVNHLDYREDFKKERTYFMKLCNSNNNWEGLRENIQGRLLLYILNKRAEIVKIYGDKIRGESNSITSNEWTIVDSVIHLHCNRLFGINRVFEKKIKALCCHTLYALKFFK